VNHAHCLWCTVTGAARGIGLRFIEILSERPDTVVFAGVRSLPLPDNSELGKIAAKHPDVVFPIQLQAADEIGNQATAQSIKEQFGKVDVLIANAGESRLLLSLPGDYANHYQ
jgi:NAD(P)-dependent dehydrogenase (short-subunit alcohol dehydrogenase family)